jgi:hypothetical protein
MAAEEKRFAGLLEYNPVSDTLALRGGESLVVRVNGYRSILNAYDTGKEAETFFSSLNKSEGTQRALCGGESLIVRVNSHRSILNAYDAGREAI